MSASLATFASPLGALHHANPSTASSHTPFSGLFTKKTSSSSSSKKRSSPSGGDKKPLLIGRPVLISTSNGDLPAATPLYPATPSPPPTFSAGHVRTFSASSLISATSFTRSASPPPPYSVNHRSSFLDFGDKDEDEEDLPAAVIAPLTEKALVDAEVVEARMHSWDVERVQQADARLISELRRMGF